MVCSQAIKERIERLDEGCQLQLYAMLDGLEGGANAGQAQDVSQFFGAIKIEGEPLQIQREMRDEWN